MKLFRFSANRSNTLCGSCPDLDGRGECRLWAAGTRADIDQAFSRRRCSLKGRLEKTAHRLTRLQSADGRSIEAEDLVQEVFVKVLAGSGEADRPLFQLPSYRPEEIFAWLVRLLRNTLWDDHRHRLGRKRCGNCRHYSRLPAPRCQGPAALDRRGEPHPHFQKALPPNQSPQDLRPPCETYLPRAVATGLEEAEIDLETAAPNPEENRMAAELRERVREGLSVLGRTSMRQLVIVQLNFFQGLPLEDIAGRLDVSLRTVKRDKHSAIKTLRRVLEGKSGFGADMVAFFESSSD